MISTPPDEPLGPGAWARRLVAGTAVVAFLIAVPSVGLRLPRDPADISLFWLMVSSAALGAVLQWLVWLPADCSRAVLAHDELWLPTVLGWRSVGVRPLRASVLSLSSRYGEERRWHLVHGLQPIILTNPAWYRAPAGRPEGCHTLEDVLVRLSGVEVPKRHVILRLATSALLGVGQALWIFAFFLGTGLVVLRLLGID